VSFRTRLFLAIVLAVLIPLGALAYGVRREMDRRLTSEYEGRVGSMASVIEADLARESGTIGARLEALASDLTRNNRFRLAALEGLRALNAPDSRQQRENSQLRTFPKRVRPPSA
jgi:hypothetical protein